jgi:hypothetical protein
MVTTTTFMKQRDSEGIKANDFRISKRILPDQNNVFIVVPISVLAAGIVISNEDL